MVSSIWIAFKFTRATTAVSLGYTFPALVALKLGGQGYGLSSQENFFSWVMLCLVTMVSVVVVISNIYSLQIESELLLSASESQTYCFW
ncbi:hypothetical protein HanRHA438_Chr16g0740671 [Helianthus annuus]|nr:hypothetical protein HanRHA438_Chr16g0740671 [Helianthus annuus]